MKNSHKVFRSAMCFSVATATVCIISRQSAAAPTADSGDTATSVAAADRSPREIVTEITTDQKFINTLLGKENAALKKPADRAAVAPKLLPAIHRMVGDLNDLAVKVPRLNQQISGSQMQLLALLAALGEKNATDKIEAMSASKNPAQALAGHAHQLMLRFYLTENTTQAHTALGDDLEKLDRVHPDSILLTQVTIEMSRDEVSPGISNRLLNIVANEMNNPLAASVRQQLAARKEAEERDALAVNKPLTLTGKLPDGTAFSTNSLKGKVVLVDFWATWCGPCKAELPRVKKIYADYHSKGLEVVGISNDYDVEALKTFVAKAEMPWPQLFDADAAANQKWNSLTSDQNIDSIPAMYLIDKKGILRTENARNNMEELIPKLLAEAD